jgi:hypothetical protein
MAAGDPPVGDLVREALAARADAAARFGFTPPEPTPPEPAPPEPAPPEPVPSPPPGRIPAGRRSIQPPSGDLIRAALRGWHRR